ncbi:MULTISPECIES: sugar ABC transporter permease [unclassified Haladaptatus]|uniref:carbohydrate ABC transporter permease n=1 Tax=unclassified Haladaptatus TaxID=2622732 RepID=UPI00209C31CB|nr:MULTISPECIES: sugar ABC transporter permease [unclassified Haladaptatus]MCO8243712.1 sugar ABC transporter permease [Haladaptatus sp. AB643]MCO8255121.1 sugar ABC transporter permease [Haladaptatus sp. AB618]
MSLDTQSGTNQGTQSEGRFRSAWNEYLPVWLATPMVLVVLLITIFPGIYDLYLSLVNYNYVHPEQLGTFTGLHNFRVIFTDPVVWKSITVTAIFVTCALILELVIGFFLAALLTNVENRWAETFYRIVFILPMAVAPVSLAMIGRIMLDPQLGIIAYAINTYTPFAAPNFLTNLPLLTVILMDAWNWTPFMFIILYAGMSSVPDELKEAARIDGAPTWRTYVHVIIPYMKPVIFVAFLIRLIDLFRTFGTVYGLTRGGPGNATKLISIQIFQTGFTYIDIGAASALAIVYLVVVLIICNVLIRVVGFEGVLE